MIPEITLWDTVVDEHEHTWDSTNVAGREAMVGFLSPGESVLDVGCGNGFVYRLAKQQGLEFKRYTGVDLSQKFLDAAKKLSPELELFRADAEDLPFKDGEFDTVFLMHILDCTNGYKKAVLEALRVANKRVVVCFWRPFRNEPLEDLIKPLEPYGFESMYSKKGWFDFLESLGLSPYPYVELWAGPTWYNGFYVMEKKNLKGVIPKEATPEVLEAFDKGTPPPEPELKTVEVDLDEKELKPGTIIPPKEPPTYSTIKRDVEQENSTWNPPIDIQAEGPNLVAPGRAEAPGKTFKGLGEPGPLKEVIVDSDDLCDEYDPYEALLEVKKRFPKFKITLFTIPMTSSEELIKKYKQHDWIELAVHGYKHDTNREFEHVNYDQANVVIPEGFNKYPGAFVKVFKAPGWMISLPVLQWLKDNDWGVMSHSMDSVRPEGLKTLVYADKPNNWPEAAKNIIHTHTWDCCGNGLDQVFRDPWFFDENTEFKFVSESLTPWKA